MAHGDVEIRIRGDNANLKKALRQSESDVKGFGNTVKNVFGLIAGAIAINRISAFGQESMALYKRQEEAEARLGAVLKATGNAAGFSQTRLKEVASALQSVTRFGDEAVMEMQAVLATFRNVRGDNFTEATELALDLAEVLGTDASSAAMQLGKALNDPEKGLSMLTRVGIQFTDSQKDMIARMSEAGDVAGAQGVILEELQNQVGGTARAMAETEAGALAQFQNRLGDLQEVIGGALVPTLNELLDILDPILGVIENMTSEAQSANSEFTQWGDTIGEGFTGFWKTFSEYATMALTAVDVGFRNIQDVAEIAWKTTAFLALGFFNDMIHFFTATLPELLRWFSENWPEVFLDVANYTVTIFKNLWKNVEDFFNGLWSWLSGGEGEFKFTALTDGFESSLRELPDIAKRELSETEKSLRSDVMKLGLNLGKEYQEQVKIALQGLDEVFKPPEPKEDPKDLKPDMEVGDIDLGRKEKEKKEKAKRDRKSKSSKEESRGGETVGLEDLTRRIQEAAAGRGKSFEQKLVEEIQELPGQFVEGVTTVADKVKEGAMEGAKQLTSLFESLKNINEEQKAKQEEQKNEAIKTNKQIKKLLQGNLIGRVT